MKTCPTPGAGTFRRHAVILTSAGFLLGAAAGTFIYTVERPVYESTARFRPLRSSDDKSGIPHGEWLQNEIAALGSEQCLLRVVKNLNLEKMMGMTAGEAVEEVKDYLRIEREPGTSIVNVSVRGEKAAECASLANAILTAREEMTASAIETRHRQERQMLEARVHNLTTSVAAKYDTLVAAPRRPDSAGDFASDAALLSASLPPEATAAREAWVAEKKQLTDMRERLAEASLTPSIPPYAELLQRGRQSVTPIGPNWLPRTARWTVIGASIGLMLSLALAAFRRRMNQSVSGPQVFPPRPVAAGDF